MHVLTRKLWHTIWANKGQFLAMAAVITVGISLYISISTAFTNLGQSQQDFYRENNFADYYFHVVRAPQTIAGQIESIPGVSRVTMRIQKDVAVIKESGQRATVRVTSYDLPLGNEVNKIELLEGRMFEKSPSSGGIEVLTDPQYFAANHLQDGNFLNIVAENRRVPLTVVGSATGPEFVYIMKDAGNLFPDPETFGIVMMPVNQCQDIFNLPGQVNQVIVQFNPGVNEEAVANQIEHLLEPYGSLASYPRKEQLSHAALQGELDGGKAMTRSLPVIFMGIAAGIQLVLLRRLVKNQRSQIGIMKALGYGNSRIMFHYTGYALTVSILGGILGCLLGLVFARYFSDMYAMYFNLPQAIGGINVKVILYSLLLSIGVGACAGVTASASIVAINPAESMRPQPPSTSSRSILELWSWLWQRLSTSWKMSFRTVSRNQLRLGVTLTGVAVSVALLVIALFTSDSMDYMLDQHFNHETNYDYLVYFNGPVKDYELFNIDRIKGINKAEPLLEIPVKFHFQDQTKEDVLIGEKPESNLKSPYDADGNPIAIPEQGLVLGTQTARKLGVEVGDTLSVETTMAIGPAHFYDLQVVDINHQLFGNAAYTSLQQANRILQEASLINGAMLEVDPGLSSHVEQELSDMNGIASVLSRQKERATIDSMMDSMVYFLTTMILFSLILGFAIVYNAAVMGFNERKRELAAMLTLGYTHKEIRSLMFKEALLQSGPGLLLGLPLGKLLAELYIDSIETDLFSFPVVIYPDSYLLSFCIGAMFVALGFWLAIRGIRHLNVVEMLKSVD